MLDIRMRWTFACIRFELRYALNELIVLIINEFWLLLMFYPCQLLLVILLLWNHSRHKKLSWYRGRWAGIFMLTGETETLQTTWQDSSALSPNCLLDTSVLVPKCPDTLDPSKQCRSVSDCRTCGSEVSGYRLVSYQWLSWTFFWCCTTWQNI